MKKAIIILICVFLLSTLLCGCSFNTKETIQYDTPLYSITAKDGLYNLTPKNPLSDIDASMRWPLPQFQSVAEMRQGIISGSFTENELYALSLRSPSAAGGIEICDVNNLYHCTAPADLNLKCITWCGKYYDFAFSGETVWGGVNCYNKEDYTEKYDREYQFFFTNPYITLLKQEENNERSATIYYGNTDVAELKFICYEIRVGNKKMFVQEIYRLKHNNDKVEVSSEVPQRVEFWGEENGGYFYGNFFDFTERPSVEWLSEFGITPLDT